MRIGPVGADDQVGEAVAVDVAGRGDREAAVVTGRHAAELEAVGAVEGGEVEIGAEARGLAEHHIARPGKASMRIGSASPMIRSAKPSPLTSPAEATEMPLIAGGHAAELEAVGAVEGGEVEIGGEARGLAEHHIARPGIVPCGSAPLAPTIRSAKPSPLTSPAEATERPL